MRVVFAGTPEFAAIALAAIEGAGHPIPLVLTQPDRPAGRGLKLAASAVGRWAEAHGLHVEKPPSLRAPETAGPIRDAHPDVMVVAAYGLILPPHVLAIPRHGCINIHASLLPRWRGAAPIQRAILAGDAETGISIMQMDEGLDTGDVLLRARVPIGMHDTAGTLADSLARAGARAIVEALAHLDQLPHERQDAAHATYAAKITRAEARIDWRLSNVAVDRIVRAFNPVPGAETVLAGGPLKLWRARPVEGSGDPGKVLYSRNSRLVVGCGEGALEVLEIQRSGARRMAVTEYLRGSPIDEGVALGEGSLASP